MEILFFIAAFYAIHTIVNVVRRIPRNNELPFFERKVEMTHRSILAQAGAAMLIAISPLGVLLAMLIAGLLLIRVSIKKKLIGKVLGALLTKRAA